MLCAFRVYFYNRVSKSFRTEHIHMQIHAETNCRNSHESNAPMRRRRRWGSAGLRAHSASRMCNVIGTSTSHIHPYISRRLVHSHSHSTKHQTPSHSDTKRVCGNTHLIRNSTCTPTNCQHYCSPSSKTRTQRAQARSRTSTLSLVVRAFARPLGALVGSKFYPLCASCVCFFRRATRRTSAVVVPPHQR